MRALIVDDELAVSRILSRYLIQWGWVADEAPCVSSAFDAFRRRPYDLLISDVDLPDGDGVILAHALLKANPELTVIIVSGDPDNLGRARKGGLPTCLHKPFALEELRVLIDLERAGKS